jgi:hypothetical protein
MEQKYEEINPMTQKHEQKLEEVNSQQLLGTASESLLANLPILILGLVVFLAVIRELIV